MEPKALTPHHLPCRFHQVEPQADLPPLPQEELSKVVTTRAKRTVPYPLLGENTLVRL